MQRLGGSWDLASRLISTLIGVESLIHVVALFITLVTKSHEPLSVGLAHAHVPSFRVPFWRRPNIGAAL